MRLATAAVLALWGSPLSAAVRSEAPATVPVVFGLPSGPAASPLPRWEAPSGGPAALAGLILDRPLPPLSLSASPIAAPAPSAARAGLPAPPRAGLAAGPMPAPVAAAAGGKQLRELEGLGEGARAAFEGERLAAADAPAAGSERRSAPLGASGPEREDGGERRTPRKPAAGFILRATAAASLSAAVLYPQLMGERPAMYLVSALAMAWTAALAVELAWQTARLGLRLLEGKSEPSSSRLARGLKGLGAAVVGASLGAGLGSIPAYFAGPAIQEAARHYAPEARVEVLGGEFPAALAAAIRENPEGAAVLKALEDRRGTVRLPSVFVARGVGTPLRYVAVLDAVFIDASAVEERGWSAADFAVSAELQARLARELRAEGARELFRAGQARRSLLTMHPEEQGLSGGLMEAEYEAALAKQRFVHAALREDPSTPLTAADLAEYEAMLDDLPGALRRLDALPRHRGYSHRRDPHYTHLLLRAEFDNPELAVEGYRLLARRAETPEERGRWLDKARRREKDEGLGAWDWETAPRPRKRR